MYRLFLALIAFMLLSGCLTGSGPLSSKSDSPHGTIVVGAVRVPPAVQAAAEARMAAVLTRERNVNVVKLSTIQAESGDLSPQGLVRRVLKVGATAVIILDPFVFEENRKTVVRSIVLSGLRKASPDDVVNSPPVTYKAAVYDVDKVIRAWMDDVNSPKSRKSYEDRAATAGESAIMKAVKARVI